MIGEPYCPFSKNICVPNCKLRMNPRNVCAFSVIAVELIDIAFKGHAQSIADYDEQEKQEELKEKAESRTELLKLIESALPIVELWNAAESPSQKRWQKDWLKKAREALSE